MFVAFTMLMVLKNHFLWWSLIVCLDTVKKRRRRFGIKQLFVSESEEPSL